MTDALAAFIPTDPLFKKQWHLLNTGQIKGAEAGFDINVIKVWADYTGKGVLVVDLDDGFDQMHPDLVKNYRADLSWDFDLDKPGGEAVEPGGKDDFGDSHGTAVAGLIAETANNGIGGAGVAFGAQVAGYRWIAQTEKMMDDVPQKIVSDGISVWNNSWGLIEANFIDQALQETFWQNLEYAAHNGRNGLGTAIVFSSGNAREYGHDTNGHATQNSPYTIVVAAGTANGGITSYSTPGATVLVTSPGSDPASIVTTDRQSSLGYNKVRGVDGNYTDTTESAFNGTSAAAPIVSGVVALMLEANPDLGYRDIQEILVYSSKRGVFLDMEGVTAVYNGAVDWNGGGLLTGDDFGYGHIDALAAVRLAETWHKTGTTDNLQILNGNVLQKTLSVAAGAEASVTANFAADARVEQITVTVDMDATRLQDVKLELISPKGTISTLINHPKPLNKVGTESPLPTSINDYTLNTVRDWGESLAGNWTLRLVNEKTGEQVRLNDWSIKAYSAESGEPGTQIFTNEFITFVDEQSSRATLSSSNGSSLNAAAVTEASTIDLTGGTSHIGSVVIQIADPQTFVTLVTGDGNDILKGNDLNNLLIGGRGSDLFYGGVGTDTASFIWSYSDFDIDKAGDIWTLKSVDKGTDYLTSIERLQFADRKMALDLAAYQPAGQTAELLGAAFGASIISNEGVFGITLGLFDKGNLMVDVSQAAIDTDLFKVLAGSSSNTDLVNLVYSNVVGTAPSAAERDMLTGLLQGSGGSLSQAEFLAWIATTEANCLHINLAGLQTTGVEYI